MKTSHSLESLEPRIAPSVIIHGNIATYTDVDGDLVTIKTSAASLTGMSFITVGGGSCGGGAC